METSIVLFDLASGISVPLSPYTTMVRLALNAKKLNYTTQWLHFPDVEPTLKANGFQPTGKKVDGSPRYTVPAVIDRTNPDEPVILADSTPIIEYLEKTYPTPGIALLPEPARPLLHFFDQYIMSELTYPTYVNFLLCTMYTCFPPEDQPAYVQRLTMTMGKHPKTFKKVGEEREEAWKKLEKTLNTIGQAYDKSSGPFIVPGSSPTIADLRLASALFLIKAILPGELWREVSAIQDGRWVRFVDTFMGYYHQGGVECRRFI